MPQIVRALLVLRVQRFVEREERSQAARKPARSQSVVAEVPMLRASSPRVRAEVSHMQRPGSGGDSDSAVLLTGAFFPWHDVFQALSSGKACADA